jgi:GntR family transcriptional regulator
MANTSVSQRLQEQLSSLIAATKPGERLASEPALAKQLGVSRATLREAMRSFETQGIIRRRQGSGTYVNRPPDVIESGLEVLESIDTLAARIGLHVSQGELNVQQRAAQDEECQALSLAPCDQVTSVARVILAEGRAVAYLVDVLPVDILTPNDVTHDFKGSILDLLLKRGAPQLYTSRTAISAVQAHPSVARALGIQRGDVLLCFVGDLYTAEGRVIDHSTSYFVPGYFRFHVVRRVGSS